jgi:hypothetical protein
VSISFLKASLEHRGKSGRSAPRSSRVVTLVAALCLIVFHASPHLVCPAGACCSRSRRLGPFSYICFAAGSVLASVADALPREWCGGFAAGVVEDVVMEVVLPSTCASHGGPPRPWSRGPPALRDSEEYAALAALLVIAISVTEAFRRMLCRRGCCGCFDG